MKYLMSFILWFATAILAIAAQTNEATYTLQQRVERSKVVFRVSITNVTESLTERGGHVVAVCHASVLDVLKGTNAPKSVSFQFYAKGAIPREKLPLLVGHEYFTFLHQLYIPYRVWDGSPEGRLVEPDGKWWALDGAEGLHRADEQIEDFRASADGERIKETMSRSEFVSRIRAFASQKATR